MPSTNTGSNPDFKSKMPGTTDIASIQDAIRYLLYGGTDSASSIVNSNAAGGTLVNTDASHGLVGQLNAMKTSLTNSAIQKAYLTAKGQLITATASGVPALLSPGTDPSVGNDFVLRSNSAAASGLDWVNISTSYLPKTAGASHPLTGNLLVNGIGGANDTELRVTSAAHRYSALRLQENSLDMWSVAKETNKNFAVWGHKVDGTYRDSPFWINQSWAEVGGVTGWGAVTSNNVARLYNAGTANFTIDNASPPSGTIFLCAQSASVNQVAQINNSDLPLGTTYHFWLDGFSSTSFRITAGANVVIQSPNSMTYARTSYSVITAVKRTDTYGGSDYWMLFGDLRS